MSAKESSLISNPMKVRGVVKPYNHKAGDR